MKKTIIYIILSIMLVSFIHAQTQKPISVYELQKQMVEKTANVNTITCDFIQNKNMEYLDAVIVSKGKLHLDKKNRLRWEYKEPFSYLIIINKNKVTINTDGKVSEYDTESNKVFAQVSELIISSFNGSIFVDKKFKVEAFIKGNEYVIYMEPNQAEMKEVVDKIKMTVDINDFSVNKVVMYEKEDNYTEIIFINKKFNEVLPERFFTSK